MSDAAGEVWCWGRNCQSSPDYRIGGVWPERVEGCPPDVWSGGRFPLRAASESGRVWCWGGNDRGQLGDGSWSAAKRRSRFRVWGRTCAVAAPGAQPCHHRRGRDPLLGRQRPGSSAAADHPPEAIAGDRPPDHLQGARAIGAGGSHACAHHGRRVRCWGLVRPVGNRRQDAAPDSRRRAGPAGWCGADHRGPDAHLRRVSGMAGAGAMALSAGRWGHHPGACGRTGRRVGPSRRRNISAGTDFTAPTSGGSPGC